MSAFTRGCGKKCFKALMELDSDRSKRQASSGVIHLTVLSVQTELVRCGLVNCTIIKYQRGTFNTAGGRLYYFINSHQWAHQLYPAPLADLFVSCSSFSSPPSHFNPAEITSVSGKHLAIPQTGRLVE